MEEEPNYDISVTSEKYKHGRIAPVLRQVVETTLRHHSIASATISVAVVDDDTIARLNEQHLNHQGPTDVLTFDLGESLPRPAGSDRQGHPKDLARADAARSDDRSAHVDGEIVVSWETALRVAKDHKHGVEAELALYTVHGLLHLLGYDDHDESDARRMHEKEDDLLSLVGLGRVFTANEQAHSSRPHDVSSAAS